jgi:hypothetical protein
VPNPRIHTKLTDLPSYGEQMIKFCEEIGYELLPWQQWLAHHSLKYKPDGRWAHPVVTLLCARQQGKSTFMALQNIIQNLRPKGKTPSPYGSQAHYLG